MDPREGALLVDQIQRMRQQQAEMDESLRQLRRENSTLWQELAVSRQMHQKQQQIVSVVLGFDGGLASNF